MLREEDNMPMRAGFIAGSGFLGLLVGMARGRFFKRLFYTSLGAGTAAVICYPQEANELSKGALDEAERLGRIGYNFVTGGKNFQA